MFPWTFLQKNWAMGFLTIDNDFHCFSIVDKDFDRLLMDEIGWSGFSIDEVSFHSFPINHINFPEFTFKETSFHALHLYEIVSPGGPLNEVILVFLSPLMKAVFIDSTSEEQNLQKFLSMIFTSIDFKSIQLVSIDFFSNRNDTHGFLFNETDFQRNLIQNFFPRNSFLQILISWNSNQSKLLFPFFQFENEFPPNSRWWSWF